MLSWFLKFSAFTRIMGKIKKTWVNLSIKIIVLLLHWVIKQVMDFSLITVLSN